MLSAATSLKAFWNTPANDSTQTITITKAGEFSVNVRGRDQFGCFSDFSDAVKLSIRPIPAKPTIATNTASACEGSNIILTASSNFKPFWTTNDTTRSITLSKVADYSISLRVIDGSCFSPFSNAAIVSIHANPARPTIAASGALNICENVDAVTLTASGFLKAYWTTNDSTRSITLTKSGDYIVSAKVKNEFNCFSPQSASVKVSIRPRPNTSEIMQTGTFSLEAVTKDVQVGDIFEWKKDNAILTNKTTQAIKTSQQGYYTVQSSRKYSLDNNVSLTCRSQLSGIVSYIPDPFLNNLAIYPNPNTTGIFTLETKDDLTDLGINVYSMHGQHLFSGTIPIVNDREILDFSTFAAGEYIIKFQNGTFKSSKKILIDKK